jgi:hypothetical protein
MRITKTQIKEIIKQELEATMGEDTPDVFGMIADMRDELNMIINAAKPYATDYRDEVERAESWSRAELAKEVLDFLRTLERKISL